MRRLFSGTASTKGATSIEYALFAGILSVVLVGPAQAVGERLTMTSDAVSHALAPTEMQIRTNEDDCDDDPTCAPRCGEEACPASI